MTNTHDQLVPLFRLFRGRHLHSSQHPTGETIPHEFGPLQLVARGDCNAENEARPLPCWVHPVRDRIAIVITESRRGGDQRIDVGDLSVPSDRSRRIVIDLDLERVDPRLCPTFERRATSARRCLVVHVNDEGRDNRMVVLAVAKADQALEPPELHACPMVGVRKLYAYAVLPVGPPAERSHLELLERRRVLGAPLAALRRRAIVFGRGGWGNRLPTSGRRGATPRRERRYRKGACGTEARLGHASIITR